MDECIPKTKLPDRRNLPWLTNDIIRTIYEEIKLYIRKLESTADLKILIDSYVHHKCLRNKVVSMLHFE